METLTSKIDNLEKELKEQQSKNELEGQLQNITDSTNEKFKELEDELKSIKNPIKKSPHKIQN